MCGVSKSESSKSISSEQNIPLGDNASGEESILISLITKPSIDISFNQNF